MEEVKPSSEETCGQTILIAEDYHPLLHMTSSALQDSGYRVLSAGSFTEAVRHAEAQAPRIDLLIADIEMPGANGIALYKRVIAIVPNIKTLFVSGNAEQAMYLSGSIGSSFEFLAKPYAISDLLKKTREMLMDRIDGPQN